MKKLLTTFFGLALVFSMITGCSSASQPLKSIAIYPKTLNLKPKDTKQLKTVLTPKDTEDTSLIWSSSDENVAKVSDKGKVTAVGSGSCTITAASSKYSKISKDIAVTVKAEETTNTNNTSTTTSDTSNVITYVAPADTTQVYPSYYLSEAEVSAMDKQTIQFVINQIYAKNGYIFQTQSYQDYFSQMSWYKPISHNISPSDMSAMDRANVNLLIKYRDTSINDVGYIWTYYATNSQLTESYVRQLSQYDIQLLINTIYAKNGYLFHTPEILAMFNSQPWYHGTQSDQSKISLSSLDQSNLNLLVAHRQ